MKRTDFSQLNCSISRTVAVIGDRWSMLILRDAFMGIRRFDAFAEDLGIARNILAARLEKLVECGVLEKRPYEDRPMRYEYRLTDKGRDLYPILISLLAWGDKWESPSPPLILEHACGHRGHPELTCIGCRAHVDPRDMRPLPGPGMTSSGSTRWLAPFGPATQAGANADSG